MTTPQFSPQLEADLERLASDFYYWAYMCYHIADKFQRTVPLEVNHLQQKIEQAENELLAEKGEARLFVLKARQGGVTTHQQAKNLHTIWSIPNSNVITLAHRRDSTDKIFEITRHAIRHFPKELLHKRGERETREVSFDRLNSHFYTETAGAGDSARSVTLLRAHLSEGAFYDSLKNIIKVVTPTLVPSGSVLLIETTASGHGSEAHEFWKAAKQGLNGFTPLFFPWWECDPPNYRKAVEPGEEKDILATLEKDEAALVKNHGLDVEQIKWRRLMIQTMGGKNEFLQEYPEDDETCWMLAGNTLYNVDVLRALMLTAPEPVEEHLDGALKIYSKADGERVIIGADVAEGVGGDATTFSARSFPSWRKLAEYRNNTVEPREFANILATWGRRYNGALLVVEKNEHGITVLRHLRDDHQYPLSKIYHRPVLDTGKKGGKASKENIGWATTEESKPLLIDAGRELLWAITQNFAANCSIVGLREAASIRRDEKTGRVILTGKDVWVSECLAWVGRNAPHTPTVMVS